MKNKTNTTRDALQLLGFRVTERADGKFRVARSGAAVILGRLELCHPVDVMNLWLIQSNVKFLSVMGYPSNP